MRECLCTKKEEKLLMLKYFHFPLCRNKVSQSEGLTEIRDAERGNNSYDSKLSEKKVLRDTNNICL